MDASLPDGIGGSKVNPPRISVVIVNWNNQVDTLACLASLSYCQYPELEIIVVDNGSTDGSVDAIEEKYSKVKVLKNVANLGYTGGNNQGIRIALQSGADYILLLNNDAEIAADALDFLVEFLESQPQVWAAAPLIYYYNQPKIIWSAGGKINPRRATAQMLGTDEEDHGQFGDSPFVVDYATGCALMVRRSTVEKFGLLDDRFFMYYEEVEWCGRMQKNGLEVAVVPKAKTWHKINPKARNDSPIVHYLMTRNRLLWIRCANFGTLVFLRVMLFENLRTLLSWTLRPKWKLKQSQSSAMLQAIIDVLRNHFGPPHLRKKAVKREILLERTSS